ncbi:UDP-N-acetylglucosamine 1-carboxyvinyltransferase [hydrothermal vent metagenome]|uniref:UDP-N-acetylglucosamine 1-carboxyvinyltransferase n=1 Tax=hydrothermal vent metagenome TaxID=652676 RepID=A0A3B0STA2_9ZZZZ
MDSIIVAGGNPLVGKVAIHGAKNSALKLMVAALLTDEPVTLSNMPDLADTRFLAHLLRHLGAKITLTKTGEMTICANQTAEPEAPYDLVRKMRATFNVLGPLLARQGRAKVSLPGGCAIGARPVDLHLTALTALGAKIELDQGYAIAHAPNGLLGTKINFPFVSVGATEHTMMAAVLAKGETVLSNAAREPEITDLANMLNKMGARIKNAGQGNIHITGVAKLHGVSHAVVPDRIEAGTYALAAAACPNSNVQITNCIPADLESLWAMMQQAGVKIEQDESQVRIISGPNRPKPVDMETAAWPGFATDLQAQFMALMTLADGASIIRETIFENRFMHAPELARLGADITVHGREAVVRGVEQLTGAPVMATDLRASVSLVIAGLAASGQTRVSRVYHLDRGFQNLEAKLSALGANIRRVKEA